MTALNISDAYILVIDDDRFFTNYIESCLAHHRVDCSLNGQSHLDPETINQLDLVILDIDLEGHCGYEICKQVRRINKQVPVLFTSGMSDFDARIKAYGAGGNDYLSKPFCKDEINYKTQALIAPYQRTKSLSNELQQASSLVRGIQTDSANLNIINRYVLASSQCKDTQSLSELFLKTLSALGTEGVLQIEGEAPKSCCGQVSRLEAEILEMACQLPRIYSFGKRRAYFGWSNCRLLVRNVTELIDVLALLMDATETRLRRINDEQRLIQEISLLEEHSHQSKDAIAELFSAMTDSISQELLMLGIVSSLNEDEEERIKSLLDQYSERIQVYLTQQESYNLQLRQAIETLRKPAKVIDKNLLDNEEPGETVELF